MTTTPPEGAPSSVVKEYDIVGRLTAYTDGDGGRTETTYDRYGKPVLEEQFQGEVLIGSREFAYNLTDEPRGFLTSIEDSVGGLITAEWGPDGQLVSESLPGGVELSITYDPASVPVARQYTVAGQQIWQDSVVENHRGQWIGHTSTTGVASYAYDDLGRLVAVDDVVAGVNTCTRRTYAYDGHSNRTSSTSAMGEAASNVESAVCPTEPDETVSSTYDSADRLVSGFGGSGWVYDALGRITSMPGADGTGSVVNEFFVNDLVAAQTVPGVARVAWGLDALQRRSTYTELAWVNGAWAASVTKVSHYSTDSDEPGWIVEDASLGTDVTRFVSGVEGDLAVSTSLTGARVVNLVDLHRDVVGTVPIADGRER